MFCKPHRDRQLVRTIRLTFKKQQPQWRLSLNPPKDLLHKNRARWKLRPEAPQQVSVRWKQQTLMIGALPFSRFDFGKEIQL